MAYDGKLAARVRKALEPTCAFTEKRMFGGLCFLIQGHMCCGVLKDELLLRLEPSEVAALLSKPHIRPMDFTGKAMRGFLYVGSEALKSDGEVRQWVSGSVAFVRYLPPKDDSRTRPSPRRQKNARNLP
jgi:hypothetical protein